MQSVRTNHEDILSLVQVRADYLKNMLGYFRKILATDPLIKREEISHFFADVMNVQVNVDDPRYRDGLLILEVHIREKFHESLALIDFIQNKNISPEVAYLVLQLMSYRNKKQAGKSDLVELAKTFFFSADIIIMTLEALQTANPKLTQTLQNYCEELPQVFQFELAAPTKSQLELHTTIDFSSLFIQFKREFSKLEKFLRVHSLLDYFCDLVQTTVDKFESLYKDAEQPLDDKKHIIHNLVKKVGIYYALRIQIDRLNQIYNVADVQVQKREVCSAIADEMKTYTDIFETFIKETKAEAEKNKDKAMTATINEQLDALSMKLETLHRTVFLQMKKIVSDLSDKSAVEKSMKDLKLQYATVVVGLLAKGNLIEHQLNIGQKTQIQKEAENKAQQEDKKKRQEEEEAERASVTAKAFREMQQERLNAHKKAVEEASKVKQEVKQAAIEAKSAVATSLHSPKTTMVDLTLLQKITDDDLADLEALESTGLKFDAICTLVKRLGGTVEENRGSHKRLRLNRLCIEISSHTSPKIIEEKSTQPAVGTIVRPHGGMHNSGELCYFNLNVIRQNFAKVGLTVAQIKKAKMALAESLTVSQDVSVPRVSR